MSLEKWLCEDLSEAEQAQLEPALLERPRSHSQNLIDEGIRSVEEHGWIDGDKAMRCLRKRLNAQGSRR